MGTPKISYPTFIYFEKKPNKQMGRLQNNPSIGWVHPKSVTQHSYLEKKPNKQMGRLQNNPSIGWVHPKSVTQHSYFEKKPNKQMGRLQNSPSIGWVHPKSTHARPLDWGNNKTKHNTSCQREREERLVISGPLLLFAL